MPDPQQPFDFSPLANIILGHRRSIHQGIVLASAVVWEVSLQRALTNVMRPLTSELKKRLFENFNGPLSTFSTRILMARALGIVDDKMFKELEDIRQIRNKFAHAINLVNFESEGIAALVKKMGFSGGDVAKWWLGRITHVVNALDNFKPPKSETEIKV